MDRIDGLLEQLLDEHRALRGIAPSGSYSGPRRSPNARDALRQQIADEWRDMVEGLELSLEWLDAVCDELHEIATPEGVAVARQIKGTLARTKGVIVNNPNG